MRLDLAAVGNSVEQTRPSVTAAQGNSRKNLKAAADFEAILLSSILEKFEQSVSLLPDDSQESAVTNSYKGMASQALGAMMAQQGGVGFARMIATGLDRLQASETKVSAELADPVRGGARSPATESGLNSIKDF